MIFSRRRYYFWLIRAYIKRWRATIFTSAILGVVIFFAFIAFLTFYVKPFIERKIEKIGVVGVYTPDTLPVSLLSDVSFGLTSVDDNDVVHPAAASSWQIKNNGRQFIFFLKHNLHFQNGTLLTTKNLNLNFKDVTRKNIDEYTVSFSLKNPYEPFLDSVERPIFLDNYVGLGNFTVNRIDLNAGFIKSISLQNGKDESMKKNIYFYPTQDSLKLAFALGDVNTVQGLTDLTFKGQTLTSWKNVKTEKTTNYEELVTLFYNNEDTILSDKKLRQALTYALPESFPDGERAYSPLSPKSPYYVKNTDATLSDLDLAKTVLSTADSKITKPLEISTTEEFLPTAKIVQAAWKKLGISTKIKVVDGIPADFRVFLYQFRVNKDPDQYTLWHSKGENNIADYRKNLRIDKLLEDGRQTFDHDTRMKIYADFQKYLLDDSPASFLYFPYQYTLRRG